jgi:hypothetical protein
VLPDEPRSALSAVDAAVIEQWADEWAANLLPVTPAQCDLLGRAFYPDVLGAGLAPCPA